MNKKDILARYVPYYEPSAAYAKRLAAKTDGTPLAVYRRITNWASGNVAYDYIKASRVKAAEERKTPPDVETTWTKRMGICADIASLVAGMLRAGGIDAHLCYGYATFPDRPGKRYHAWVEADVGGKPYRYDHEAAGRNVTYVTTRRF